MFRILIAPVGVGLITLLSACAPEPVPTLISVEPTFDKFNVPSCRPVNTPVGGIYTADLPLCLLIAETGAASAATNLDLDEGSITASEVDDPTTGDDQDINENQNQNRNENQNQNENTNQNRGG